MSTFEPWFGLTPAHWQVRRLGSLGTLTKGSGGSKEDNRDVGLPVVRYGELYSRFGNVITEAHSFIGEDAVPRYTPLQPGTIVFAGSGEDPEDIGRSALSLLDLPAYVGGDTVLFRPREGDCDPLYLAYVLESRPLKALKALRSTGFTVVHISAAKLKTLPVPLPPLSEQRAISAFLESETAQIDNLICEQKRLIDLLSERQQALASGVLGVRVGVGVRLKWLFSESDVRAGQRASELPLLSVSISWGVRRRDQVTDDEARAEDLSNYKVCAKGVLVINRMRAFQGALGLAPEDGIVSPDYAVLKLSEDVDAPWLAAVMKTPSFVGELARRVKGIGSSDLGSARTPRINLADLGEIRVDVPSQRQQVAERDDMAQEVVRIQRLIDEAERFIELATERRSALITGAITGQINMRSVA